MSLRKKEVEKIQANLKEQIKQSKGWYFITFAKDLPNYRPYAFTLYDEPFVLLRNKAGKLVCYLLPLHNETNNLDAALQSFSVVERQGMIWFWRKTEEADKNLIPTINNFDELLEENIKMVDP